MDAIVVIRDLQHRNIIADGDVNTISRQTGRKVRNQILHEVLTKKCTDETFKVACEVIIGADRSNAVMVQLAEDMKRSLEFNAGKWCVRAHVCVHMCACTCVCACMCVLACGFPLN